MTELEQLKIDFANLQEKERRLWQRFHESEKNYIREYRRRLVAEEKLETSYGRRGPRTP
jgi:hypothetical protein